MEWWFKNLLQSFRNRRTLYTTSSNVKKTFWRRRGNRIGSYRLLGTTHLPHASRSEKKEKRDCANQGEPKRLRHLFRNTHESILDWTLPNNQIERTYFAPVSIPIELKSRDTFCITTKVSHQHKTDPSLLTWLRWRIPHRLSNSTTVVLTPVLTRTIRLRDRHWFKPFSGQLKSFIDVYYRFSNIPGKIYKRLTTRVYIRIEDCLNRLETKINHSNQKIFTPEINNKICSYNYNIKSKKFLLLKKNGLEMKADHFNNTRQFYLQNFRLNTWVRCLFFNPLTPMGDQDRISPYNINTISIR